MTRIIIEPLDSKKETITIDLDTQTIMQQYFNRFRDGLSKDFEYRLSGRLGLYKLRISD